MNGHSEYGETVEIDHQVRQRRDTNAEQPSQSQNAGNVHYSRPMRSPSLAHGTSSEWGSNFTPPPTRPMRSPPPAAQRSNSPPEWGNSIAPRGNRPIRPPPPMAFDSKSSPSEWGPMTPNSAVRYLADTPTQSRSGSPTLSGRATPLGFLPPSPFDSRPSSYYQSNQSVTALLPPGRHLSPGGDDLDSFNIARLHDRDDVDTLKGWKRHMARIFVPILAVVNSLLYLVYLGLRIACVIWASELRHTTYPQAWVFIGVEVAVAVPSLTHNIWMAWSLKKRNRPKLRLVGDEVPSVDVFITCCGEEDHLVLDTVRAALEIDYPTSRFKVIILDDAHSPGLEQSAVALGKIYPNLYYMAREKLPGVPHHFKAGNLNYGLEAVNHLPGGRGQYMAALDADMIPEPAWLRAILPHLVSDPKMALACPPQLFYNTPPSDPLAQSLDFFVHVIEPIKDALGVAWCTGSGYCVRRTALDEIGNFPLGSLAEDVATSTLMLGRGWKTAYVHEPLQYGTVPEDYGGHLKQRTRWAIGTVDTSFKLNFCLWGDQVRQMTAAQRFSGFMYATLSMYTILLTISLFAIPVILVMEKPLVAYATQEQLRWLIRACFASTICNRLCEFVLFMPSGYHTGQRGARYQLWMSPYIALCLVRSFILPTWLGGQTQAFKPTGSLGSALNERDEKLKKNMFRRMWAILINYMGIFHFAFVYLTLAGVVLTTYRCFYQEVGTKNLLLCLLTHSCWPPLTWIFMCSALWTPVSYAIDPPMMPDREDLLNRDPKTKVAHPTAKSKKIAFSGQAAWFETEYTFTTMYTCLVFVASFLF